MDENTHTIGVLANGCAMMVAQLVEQLDKAGAISKIEFADALVRLAELGKDIDVRGPRLDLVMMKNCALVLRDEEPDGWTPRVIDGGRDS